MATKRTLIVVGTDGFRDYVQLPDARTFNLGTVSVLHLVTELALNGVIARRALDTFLAKKRATLAVDMEKLAILLKPKRSRWAGIGNELIPAISSTPSGTGKPMPQNSQFETHLSSIETVLQYLDRGSSPSLAAQVGRVVQASVREMIACCGGCGDAGHTHEHHQEPAPVVVQEPAIAPPPEVPVKLAAVDQDLKQEIAFFMDNEGSLVSKKKAVLTGLLRKMKAGKYDAVQAKKAWESWVDAGVNSYAKEFKEDPKKISSQLREVLAKEVAENEKKAIDNGEYDHLKMASLEPEVVITGQVPASSVVIVAQTPATTPVVEITSPVPTALEPKLATEKNMDSDLSFKVKAATPVMVKAADSALSFKANVIAEVAPPVAAAPAVAAPAPVAVATPVAAPPVEDLLGPYLKLAFDEVPMVNEALAQSVMTKVETALPLVETSQAKFASVAKDDLFRISSALTDLLKTANMADPKVRSALIALSKKADHVLNHFAS